MEMKGEKNGKKWDGNEIGKKGLIVKFCLVTCNITISNTG